MRKPALFLLIPVLFFALASSAFADTLNFTVTSSVEGEAFTITFAEPSTINSLTTTTAVTVTPAGPGAFTDPNGQVEFFPTSQMGLFNVDVTNGSLSLLFEFFGPQSYSGSGPFTLLTGTFPLGFDGQNGFATSSESEEQFPLGDGKVVVTGGGTAAPEPGTFALLGAGLAGLAALRRKLRIA